MQFRGCFNSLIRDHTHTRTTTVGRLSSAQTPDAEQHPLLSGYDLAHAWNNLVGLGIAQCRLMKLMLLPSEYSISAPSRTLIRHPRGPNQLGVPGASAQYLPSTSSTLSLLTDKTRRQHLGIRLFFHQNTCSPPVAAILDLLHLAAR